MSRQSGNWIALGAFLAAALIAGAVFEAFRRSVALVASLGGGKEAE